MSICSAELFFHSPRAAFLDRSAKHECRITQGEVSVFANAARRGGPITAFRQKSSSISTLRSSFNGTTLKGSSPVQNSPRGLKYKSKKANTRISNELGGQYDEHFDDIDKHILDCFTIKAVKTLLVQLHEMNPPTYAWFYEFVATNKPNDSKTFIRKLVNERQDLAERVMVTRLHLFNKWVKRYDHANMHKLISDQNLELLRERLAQTVVFATDDMEIKHPESS